MLDFVNILYTSYAYKIKFRNLRITFEKTAWISRDITAEVMNGFDPETSLKPTHQIISSTDWKQTDMYIRNISQINLDTQI